MGIEGPFWPLEQKVLAIFQFDPGSLEASLLTEPEKFTILSSI